MSLINFAILNFLILFDSVKGSVFLQLDPKTVFLGDDNITISCVDRFMKQVELQIRRNKSDDWKPIAMVNLTRTYLTNYDINLGDFSVIWHHGICFNIFNKCFIEVKIRVHSHRCKLDPESTPILRCFSFNGEKRFYSEEKSLPGVKGKPPKNMLAPSILSKQSIRINNRESSIDVLHLQCTGEVESVNARPNKDIRWCQKVSGRFKALPFRIPPQTSTVSTSRNGCIVLQKSTINFSLSNRDSDVEIMCESEYSIANKECGEGSAHSTLYIRTDTLDEGSVNIELSQVLIPKGKNTIKILCEEHGQETKYVELQIRQDSANDWKTMAKVNKSATILTKEYHGLFYMSVLSHVCDSHRCYIDVNMTVTSQRCLKNFESRCHSFIGSQSFYSMEKRLPVIGERPKNMLPPSIISQQNIKIGNSYIDVLQLRCSGEVENIDSQPSQDIRWCQKVSGRFKPLTFPPQTRKLSSSRDQCIVQQESTINYSLSNRHLNIEIMCESGYLTSNDECGKGSAQSRLYIRMETLNEGD